MYSDVDYCRHKTVLSQFKNLTRLFILSTSIISSFAFAGAAEDRNRDILQAANDSKYSSATGKNYTVGGVKSTNGTVSARVDQRVVVGGSSAEVKTKVSFPADYKDVARTAGKLARTAGGLYLADKAFQGLMDGVDYVLDPKNNQIVKKPDPDSEENQKYTSQYRYKVGHVISYSLESAFKAYFKYTVDNNSGFSNSVYSSISVQKYWYDNDRYAVFNVHYTQNGTSKEYPFQVERLGNPDYKPDHVPESIPVTPAEMEDAFYKWMINNPTSVTDPVTSYMYSPKSAQTGLAQPSSADPSFGTNEITDEMMDNYIRNRDIELNKPGSSYEIKDSATTETDKTGTTIKTETKPDGSKTTTTTKTEKDPVTGEIVTTVTETTVKPDGTTETTTSTEKTDVKPETKLPPACEYFATLCDWMNWTKENTETPEDNDIPKIEKIEVGQLDTGTFKATAGCPSPYAINVPLGKGGNVEISYEPLCQFATKWSFVAPLIGFFSGAMIIVGVGRKGEDSEL